MREESWADGDQVFYRVTPGTCHATRSASLRSAHERTVPLSVTTLPSASTVTRLASSSALRRKDSSIFRLMSAGVARGLISIRLVTLSPPSLGAPPAPPFRVRSATRPALRE